MKIAVLSGKGGSGKTLVAVNLTALISNSTYVDCDVEEPNGHLFFTTDSYQQEQVAIQVPSVDLSLCDGCGKCVHFCRFNALAMTSKLLVFDHLCHACGGCALVCPKQAITMESKTIGEIQIRQKNGHNIYSGILIPGQASGTPIIRHLQSKMESQSTVFIDCPPGAACLVMDSIQEADYCILVAEPTILGVANLQLVHQLVQLFNKPYGVVLNKTTANLNPADEYCRRMSIPILGSIPFCKQISQMHAEGKSIINHSEEYRQVFHGIYESIMRGEIK